MNGSHKSEEGFILDVEAGDIVAGQKVAQVFEVETVSEVDGVKLSESRGKHIQVVLRIPYNTHTHAQLGELFGLECGVVLQAVQFEEEDGDDDAPGLFDADDEVTESGDV